MSRAKRASLYTMAVFYVVAGVMHFVAPEFYLQIMPPFVPFHAFMVYASGVAEIALGVLLLPERTRRPAAWGLVALLIAVFPANIYMAVENVQITGLPEWMPPPSRAGAWGRLPVQLLFLAWAYWHTRPDDAVAPSPA